MAAEPIVDRDAVELPVLEEDFLLEEAYAEMQLLEEGYMKDIPPLPRSHATARMWTIYSPESALSSSEAPQQTASPEAQTEALWRGPLVTWLWRSPLWACRCT